MDELPEASVPAAGVLLSRLKNAGLATFDASPVDDEPVTDEDVRPPVEMRHEVFLSRSEQIGCQLASKGVSEQEIIDDFTAARRRP